MERHLAKILIGVSSVLVFMTVSSCDEGFDVMNTNPNQVESVISENMFTSAQLATASHDLSFLVAVVQQHSTWNQGTGTAAGTRYHHDWRTGFFNTVYTSQYRRTQLVLDETADSPEDINKHSMARILKAYQFHRSTDLYGDIPYTEAGQGVEGNYRPSYDSQEFIYNDILMELEAAAQALDPGQPSFGSADLFYDGDVDQWRKFAYSLMLRLGMRLTEVAPEDAEIWVKKAIDGGVIEDNADMAYIMYSDGAQTGDRNPRASNLLSGNYDTPQDEFNFLGGKIAQPIIDHLKDTSDPRLEVVSVVWVEQPDGSYEYDNDPAIQKGMAQTWTDYPSDFATYSEPHPETLLRYDSPIIFFTAAESNLLLAEAAIRGWYTTGSAEEAYNRAVREGMHQWELYGDGYSSTVITDARIDAYLAENPFLVSGNLNEQWEQISTQKWVSLFYTDEYEQFANFRRTGFPVLTPTNVPGNHTNGNFPRRMVVPDTEEILNTENWQAAVDRQGGASWNNLLGRVWWDTELPWEASN